MTGGALKPVSIAVILTTLGLILMSGCGGGGADNSKPASCFDIKNFTVLHVSPLSNEAEICRLELNPPPGFEFVDKTGKRLPYHPYVLVKRNERGHYFCCGPNSFKPWKNPVDYRCFPIKFNLFEGHFYPPNPLKILTKILLRYTQNGSNASFHTQQLSD